MDYQPYRHGPVPYDIADLPRYLDEELSRLEETLSPRIVNVVFSISLVDQILLETTEGWGLLFEDGDTPSVEIPAGTWSLGRLKIVETGVYQCISSIVTDPVTGQGNREYEIGVGVQRNWMSGNPEVEARNAQQDDLPLTVSTVALLGANAGDTIDFVASGEAGWSQGNILDIKVYAQVVRIF